MKITHFTFIYFITFIFIPFLVYASGVNLQVTINGTCGNGTIDSGEECDGSNLNGKSCSTQGFSGGTLSCNTNCTLNTSACTSSGGGGGGGGGSFSPPSTPQTAVNFSGRAYPKSTVTLLKDAQIAATTIAGADANFQISLSGLSTG